MAKFGPASFTPDLHVCSLLCLITDSGGVHLEDNCVTTSEFATPQACKTHTDTFLYRHVSIEFQRLFANSNQQLSLLLDMGMKHPNSWNETPKQLYDDAQAWHLQPPSNKHLYPDL